MLKLLNFSCSRCLFPSDHSDHFLVNINKPTYVFRGPLEAAADAAASGQAGELLAARARVAASVLALGFVSWGRSWARLHDGTFAGDRAPTRTHGDAWLESRPSRVARRCPPWNGKAAAEGLVAAGCIGGGIAMDWQHLFGRFREGQPRFPELDRRHVAQRRVDPEVVVPVHVVRELGP